MKALIDADIINYQACNSGEYKIYTLETPSGSYDYPRLTHKTHVLADIKERELDTTKIKLTWTRYAEPLSHALQRAKNMILTILANTGVTDHKCYLTDGTNNYRKKIATIQDYKGNRKDVKKPTHFQEVRDYLVRYYGAEIIEYQEADDMLGIMQVRAEKDSTIICTIDKDLDMIPGWHYNMKRKEKYYVNDIDAIRNFYMQILKGDSADHIPGIYGIGKLTAEKLLGHLNTEEEMDAKCRETYKKAFKDLTQKQIDDRYREVGQLLWIRRQPDEMWLPLQERQ